MLANRIKVAIILLLIGVVFIFLGGPYFLGLVCLMLVMGGWEFCRLFATGGFSPSPWIVIPGIILIAITRYFWGFNYSDLVIAGLVLAAMTYHTVRCKDGCPTPAVDFAVSVGGLMYIGWLGSYLVSLRTLENGLWWIILVIGAVSIGDAGAYFIGGALGRHQLAPHVSPNKTIEGYLGGVAFTILGGFALASLCHLRVPAIQPAVGLILGSVLGILAPLGDLGESMLKRQFGVKDTGKILAAHGGMLDRMDTWIWGGVLGYYLIIWLW